jgi:AcrR family transcriptional regulator
VTTRVGAATRRGRRPGSSGSREGILKAARAEFAARGYHGATIRGIARRAGYDPALVLHFFGSKDDLFAESIRMTLDPGQIVPALLAGDRAELGERLVRLVLEVWGRPEVQDVMLSVLRSATSNEAAAAALRRFITREVLTPIAEATGLPDAPLRASLAGSQVVGLAVARYVVKVEPLASAEDEDVIRWVGPTLQRYLIGDVGERRAGRRSGQRTSRTRSA